MLKKFVFTVTTVVCVIAIMGVFSGAVFAEDAPLINGEDWTKSSEVEKLSYLAGAANLMVIEYLYQEGSGEVPSDDQTTIQRLYKAIEDITFNELAAGIDKWYSDNPDKLNEAVLVVLWGAFVEKE